MKKRRILLALIMLIICGISLTTATYAWFTINRAVSVDEIDVSAQASGGIQISADAVNWSNEVSVATLRAEAANYIPETSLRPVTTVGVNGGTGAFDFYLGELNNAGDKVKLTAVEDSDNHYVAFDLYFYSATPQKVSFNAGTQIVTNDTDEDAKLRYSSRVGFLVQGTGFSEPAAALAAKTGTLQTIWEPYSDAHTDRAITVNSSINGQEVAYMGGKAETAADGENEYVDLTSTSNFETITGTHGLLKTKNGVSYPEGEIFNFDAGISKVRVYIWLEGQDVDNEDSASLGQGFKVKLNFRIPDAE